MQPYGYIVQRVSSFFFFRRDVDFQLDESGRHLSVVVWDGRAYLL